jgi:hypothetical protein
MIQMTMRTGRTMLRTTPASVLEAKIWKRMVLAAQMAIERMKRGREPEMEMPIRMLRKFTSCRSGLPKRGAGAGIRMRLLSVRRGFYVKQHGRTCDLAQREHDDDAKDHAHAVYNYT